jgi:hypothetical protein
VCSRLLHLSSIHPGSPGCKQHQSFEIIPEFCEKRRNKLIFQRPWLDIGISHV